MVILKVLLLLIVLGFLFCVVVAVRLVWSARHLYQMFRGGQASRQEETYGHTVNTGDGTIVDRRSPQDAGKRIIADDEGEYVEFEETS